MTEQLLPRGTFKCVLLTRNRTLLDCKAKSLVVPAHDGQLGILRNHCPVMTELGLGILTVKGIQEEDGSEAEKHFLIDGGFLRASSNNITILAYDVEFFDDISMEEVDKLIEKADKLLEADAFSPQLRNKQVKKASLIKQLAKLAAVD